MLKTNTKQLQAQSQYCSWSSINVFYANKDKPSMKTKKGKRGWECYSLLWGLRNNTRFFSFHTKKNIQYHW